MYSHTKTLKVSISLSSNSFPLSSWTNISWALPLLYPLKQILSNFSDSLLPHLMLKCQTPNLPDLSASFDTVDHFPSWKNFFTWLLVLCLTGISSVSSPPDLQTLKCLDLSPQTLSLLPKVPLFCFCKYHLMLITPTFGSIVEVRISTEV